jgi:ATP-binding cassette subfamily B protein
MYGSPIAIEESMSSLRHRNLLSVYLRPQRGAVVLLAILVLSSISLQLFNPQIIRVFIDTAQDSQAHQRLIGVAVLFLIVGVLQRATALASSYLGERIGWRATNALRSDLMRHSLRLDLSFHNQHSPGELIERIDGDVKTLANFFSQLSVQVASNILLIVGILLLLLREDWRIGALLALYSLITLGVLGSLQRLGVARWEAERAASAAQYGFLEERLAGTEDIRANGAEAYVLQRLRQLMFKLLETYRAARMISNLTYISSNFLLLLGYALGLALGALFYVNGSISLGTAYLIVAYIGMLAGPLENIREQIQDLQQASASSERVEELISTPLRISEQPRATLPDGPLALRLQRVSFTYADQPEGDSPASPTLSDIDLELAPGRVLGLLGRTGSGKTTLTRLLIRLYDPTAGSIQLNDHDLRDLALSDLRSHVAIVTQDVQLFQASIRDNLTFFNKNIGDEQLLAALQELGLVQWVQQRGGLDAQLNAGGQGLSAGEAQLLAFTRVLPTNPGLVILDEASARLDPATERLLTSAMQRLMQNRTAIVIAHRLDTVQHVDDILILSHGQMAEYGPRAELAANPHSQLARLLRGGEEEVLA